VNIKTTKLIASWGLFSVLVLFTSMAAAASGTASHPGASTDAVIVGQSAKTDKSKTVLNQATNVEIAGQSAATDQSKFVLNQVANQGFVGLQAAIDAASPGDSINIVGDITEGQITVNTDNLTLTTTNGSTILLGANTGNAGDDRAWFLVPDGIHLTVNNLTFDGNGYDVYQAFRHKGTGSFNNCAFEDIEFDTGDGITGFAIVSFQNTTPVGVNVDNCTFTEFGKAAIFAFESTSSIVNSTIICSGITSDRVNYGIEAGNGAFVTATYNSITGCRGSLPGPGLESAAFLTTTDFGPGTLLGLLGNDIRDNTTGVLTPSTDGSHILAVLNSIVGNGQGISVDASQADFEDNWWGCNGGPGSTGCDSAASAGFDADPWLVLSVDPPTPGGSQHEFLPAEGMTTINANLNVNSNGSISNSAIIDGTPVAWDGPAHGTLTPPLSYTTEGAASSVYEAENFVGSDDVCATVDNETVCRVIYVGAFVIPTLSKFGIFALIALLGFLTLVRMKRVPHRVNSGLGRR
jgi:hypothetical protein